MRRTDPAVLGNDKSRLLVEGAVSVWLPSNNEREEIVAGARWALEGGSMTVAREWAVCPLYLALESPGGLVEVAEPPRADAREGMAAVRLQVPLTGGYQPW